MPVVPLRALTVLRERYDELRLVELRGLLDPFPPDRRPQVVAAPGEFAPAPVP